MDEHLAAQIAEFILGGLGKDELEEVCRHFDECWDCVGWLADLIRVLKESEFWFLPSDVRAQLTEIAIKLPPAARNLQNLSVYLDEGPGPRSSLTPHRSFHVLPSAARRGRKEQMMRNPALHWDRGFSLLGGAMHKNISLLVLVFLLPVLLGAVCSLRVSEFGCGRRTRLLPGLRRMESCRPAAIGTVVQHQDLVGICCFLL